MPGVAAVRPGRCTLASASGNVFAFFWADGPRGGAEGFDGPAGVGGSDGPGGPGGINASRGPGGPNGPSGIGGSDGSDGPDAFGGPGGPSDSGRPGGSNGPGGPDASGGPGGPSDSGRPGGSNGLGGPDASGDTGGINGSRGPDASRSPGDLNDFDNGFDGPAVARRICPRGLGLGLDGVFLLGRRTRGRPWKIDHWDADGSFSFCSNGTRAAAALLPDDAQGPVDVVSSREAALLDRRGADVGLRLPEGPDHRLADAPPGLAFPAVYAWTGTPQLVLLAPDVDAIDMPSLGPALRRHPALPHGANVSVLQVVADGLARIRTWERGVEGETLSCGQGAAAAAAWLAERTGVASWEIRPRGADALRLDVGELADRRWRDLWLRGRVRVLGEVELGPGLDRA
jgi:diaminopimelate epimerase